MFIDENNRITEANPVAINYMNLDREIIQGRKYYDPKWNAVRPDGTLLPT